MTDLGESVLNVEPGAPTAPSVDGLMGRLEEANAGNGELDARVIAAVVGGDATAAESPLNSRWCVYSGGLDRNSKPRLWEPGNQRERELRRSYIEDRGPTRSVDAALLLVPEGAVWHVMTDYGGLNRAKIGPAGRPSASIYHPRKRDEIFIQADAETPALALCIAVLKARQSPPQPERVSDRTTSNTEAAQEPPSGTPIAGGGR